MIEFSLLSLLPDFTSPWPLAKSPEAISATFVLILLAFFTCGLIYSFWQWFTGRRRVQFCESLIAGVVPDQIHLQHREANGKAREHPFLGGLWAEFDETLVRSRDGTRLYNTFDAAYFFNPSTLAPGLTDNRLLAAMPGILTALGVLGTFIGLQMGLGALDITGALQAELTSEEQRAQVAQVQTGIATLIAGASIAFLTSVWGVGLSVVFNGIEKLLEGNIRKAISAFQTKLDHVYPRITAEQSLLEIRDFSHSSTETLDGLAERIGDHLQKAVTEATSGVQKGIEQSLTNILEPAIRQLVSNAHDGSQEALRALTERFLSGVGEAGEAQRKMLDESTSEMKETFTGLSSKMEGFVQQLEGHSKQTSNLLAEQQKLLDDRLQTLGEREEARQSAMDERYQTMMAGLGQRFEAQQSELGGGMKAMLDEHRTMMLNITAQWDQVRQEYESVVAASRESSRGVADAAESLRVSAVQLGSLASNLDSAATKLGTSLSDVALAQEKTSEQQSETSSQLEHVARTLRELEDKARVVAAALEQAGKHADSGFTQMKSHVEGFTSSMEQHLSTLQKEVARLLREYGDQVSTQTATRMNAWNEHTNQFTDQMVNAVQALSQVVDDIEARVRTPA